jgi:putative ABC transport system permease protein
MNTLLYDLRYALRQLRKSPGFTLTAVLTLALGIGVNAAIFSAINAVLLRPLPYFEANRIQVLWSTNPQIAAMGYPELPPSYNDITEWRKQSSSFELVAACRPGDRNITDGDTTERVGGTIVTHNFFSLFGVTPMLGRGFTDQEDSPGRNQVAVISYGLWQRRYGGDPAIIGKAISLDGVKHTVVGVMPLEFQFPRGAELPAGYGFAQRSDVWVPFGLSAAAWTDTSNRQVVALGRLKKGITIEAAQIELTGIAARLEKQFPNNNTGMGVKLLPLRSQMVAFSRTPLLILFAAVGLVLLIACANIANLLLARVTARQKEIAIRSALGASHGRIVRQLLTESLLLAGLGALLAVGFAQLGISALLKFGPSNLPQLQETRLDMVSFLFTAAVAVLTALLSGLVPSLRAAKTDLQQAFRTGGGSASGGTKRLREIFVVSQIALALTLLVGSGLLIRSLAAVLAVDAGLRPQSVLTFQLSIGDKYGDYQRRVAFFDQFRSRLESLPGVRAVGAVTLLPLGGGGENIPGFSVEGAPPSKEMTVGEFRYVAGGYFQALGITLTKGRLFTDQEVTQTAQRVVINETLARGFFAAQDPLGKRLVVNGQSLEIVGVVGDVKSGSLEAPTRPQIYAPQAPDYAGIMAVVVRTSGDPRTLIGSVRAKLKAIDSAIPIDKVRTMEQVVGDTVIGRRFNMLLLGLFAALALVLTTIGLYGSISYWVTQRTREIGIRMALGANRSEVLWLVLKQGMTLAVFGVAAGLVAAFGLTRLLSKMLFGIAPNDPATFAAVSLLLTLVAALACMIPARRAASVEPMQALRSE